MVGLDQGLVRSALFICIWISARHTLPFPSFRTLHQCLLQPVQGTQGSEMVRFLSETAETQAGTQFSPFFECKPANQLWKKLMPLLKLVTKTSFPIHRTNFLFNSFPPGIANNVEKIVFSILQIIVYRIWINRNNIKYGGVPLDPEIDKKVVYHYIINMVRAKFNVLKRKGKLEKFNELFCFKPQFCVIDARERILVTPMIFQ